MNALNTTLHGLSEKFTALHTHKEDLFWSAKMGLTDDPAGTQNALSEAEVATNRFLQDPAQLAALRAHESDVASESERKVLQGWIALFSANVIESPAGRALSEEIVRMEGALHSHRGAMKLGFNDPTTGAWEPAGTNKLSLVMRNDKDPARRKAAHAALASVEGFVLEHGFLDIVRKRNALGRALGYLDYYDWRVSVVERMSKRTLFGALEDLARRTQDRSRTELAGFEKTHGEASLEPHNFLFHRAGKLAAALDPYFDFAPSLRRWGRSFAALGVSFRAATLTLDLVDRAGKYENGFMHGPEPAYFDRGAWRPARINFTANAVPGAVGAGLRATETLFHEGGHAAHFSNILGDAPCFSQEFAPTSVAYAETQSMFMDSLLEDADWRLRYLSDKQGNGISRELIEESVRERQPLRAWDVRAMLTVPMAERAMYEMSDDALTPENVLGTFRAIEREMQGLTAGVRPVLAVPHLLSGEASAYYHGYVMAEMAVAQIREFFTARDGHLCDNPRIGPDLAAHVWAPGNALSFEKILSGFTGKGLSADALVAECNLSTEEAVAEARRAMDREGSIPRHEAPVDMQMKLRVIHGAKHVASTEGSTFEAACEDFERWVSSLA